MIACLKLWLVYHSAWRVIELVVPAGLTLRAGVPILKFRKLTTNTKLLSYEDSNKPGKV